MKANLYIVRRADGLYYTHGYPGGTWDEFPKMQVYQNKSAASRQANALNKRQWAKLPCEVVVVTVSVDEPESGGQAKCAKPEEPRTAPLTDKPAGHEPVYQETYVRRVRVEPFGPELMNLDFRPSWEDEKPCPVCGGPHGDTCQHLATALEQAEQDSKVFLTLDSQPTPRKFAPLRCAWHGTRFVETCASCNASLRD